MSGKKTVIIGLGNPLLSDDTAGLIALRELEKKFYGVPHSLAFKENYAGGMDLLDDLEGFSRAIIIDSVCTEQAEPGFCHEFTVQNLDEFLQPRLVDSHGLTLPTVLDIGKRCGYLVPEEIRIFGIEGTNFFDFCEQPTAPVSKGLERAVELIFQKLKSWESDRTQPEEHTPMA